MSSEETRSGSRYALVCCSRMDVLYVDRLPSECTSELRKALDGSLAPHSLFVPNFHEWRLSSSGGISRTGGMNDRFAIGTRCCCRGESCRRR